MNECQVNVEYIHSEEITEENVNEKLKGLKGVLVAPGFGSSGIEGKIITARYAQGKQYSISRNLPWNAVCSY